MRARVVYITREKKKKEKKTQNKPKKKKQKKMPGVIIMIPKNVRYIANW